MPNLDATGYDLDGLLARFAGTDQGNLAAQVPKYHLFHAAGSICSQKVRATLFALDEPYTAHEVNIFKGENYDPIYVRTRVLACREAGLPLSTLHLGATSAQKTGCDACVVPTLVNNETEKVLIDSHHICVTLNSTRRPGVSSLIPQDLKHAVEEELAIVDMLPNYPLLAAALKKAQKVTGNGSPFARSKVSRCEALMRTYADDPDLLEAYTAKRDKELSADQRLFTEDAIAHSFAEMKRAFDQLDGRLQKSKGRYLFDDTLTLADLFWGAELIRAEDLHLDQIWTNSQLPILAAYYDRLANLSALRQGIIDWPDARLSFPTH